MTCKHGAIVGNKCNRCLTGIAEPPKPAINLWASFLDNEKMSADRQPEYALTFLSLAEELAKNHRPKIRPHAAKLESRRLVARIAIQLQIDLSAIKGIARGMLDAWNAEYAAQFGSNYGTAGTAEALRRDVVTRMIRP